jgi:hypothetical protein
MKIRNFIPCLLFINIAITSYTAEALDFLGDLSQAIGEVSKSTGEIAKAVNDASKEKSSAPTPVAPSKVLPTGTEIPNEFQGEWIPSNKDDSGLTITKDSISYIGNEESYSEIKRIELINLKNTVNVTYSICGEDGEGGTSCNPPTKNTFTLSNSGNSLSMSEGGKVTKYSRSGSASTLVAAPVSAVSEGKILFFCKAAKGKEIKLVNTGKGIEYSFGLPNQKSDILVSVPYEKVLYASLGGAQSTDNQVSIPNGKTFYVVYSYDYARGCGKCKSDFGHGVIVSKESKKIADVECDRKAKLEPKSNTLIYDMEDNLVDVSDLLQNVNEEDSNFKSRGFFNIVQ